MLDASQPLPRPAPHRVVVAGVSGVGKSTLARAVADRLTLPYTEIDSLYHGPNWVPRPAFDADVRDLVSRPAWVTEWQYSRARPLLAANADVLVWLDLPFRVTLTRVVLRTVRRARSAETLWNGNVEPGLWHALTAPEGIIVWAIRTRTKYRRAVPALEARHPALVIVRLRSRREANLWLSRL